MSFPQHDLLNSNVIIFIWKLLATFFFLWMHFYENFLRWELNRQISLKINTKGNSLSTHSLLEFLVFSAVLRHSKVNVRKKRVFFKLNKFKIMSDIKTHKFDQIFEKYEFHLVPVNVDPNIIFPNQALWLQLVTCIELERSNFSY